MMETCPNCHQGDYPHGDPGEARACRAEAEIVRLTAELATAREINQGNIKSFKVDHRALVFSMAEEMAGETVNAAQAERDALREALEFYADANNPGQYFDGEEISGHWVRGKHAREALAAIREKEAGTE